MITGTAVGTDPALVLVVDDNPTNRYILTACLRRAGHEVIEASDGTSALTLLRDAETLPDAAIIDVRLPDMTGFEVCEKVKADPYTAAVPVIHISASAITVTDRAQGLNRGADAYLTEPIAPDELLATVTATLRYARARRRAETLADRLGRLNRATLALYGASDAAALARGTALGAVGIFGTEATVVLRAPQGRLVRAAGAADGTVTVSEPPAAEAQELLQRHPLGSDTGVRVHTLPGADGGPARATAMARVKAKRPPLFIAIPDAGLTEDDRELLTQLAHACALSLEALRSYAEEHTLALTLQRTFLPASLPAGDRAELAVRYFPASETTEIGGDFYEALAVEEGLIVAVGDVAGHSLDAAVVMGELRHALRAYALEGHPRTSSPSASNTCCTR